MARATAIHLVSPTPRSWARCVRPRLGGQLAWARPVLHVKFLKLESKLALCKTAITLNFGAKSLNLAGKFLLVHAKTLAIRSKNFNSVVHNPGPAGKLLCSLDPGAQMMQ